MKRAGVVTKRERTINIKLRESSYVTSIIRSMLIQTTVANTHLLPKSNATDVPEKVIMYGTHDDGKNESRIRPNILYSNEKTSERTNSRKSK